MKPLISLISMVFISCSFLTFAADIPQDAEAAQQFNKQKCIDETTQSCIDEVCLNSDSPDCQENCQKISQEKCQQQENE